MKVRIGALGPPDSLQVIREVAELDPRIELVEFEYFGSEELPKILSAHRYDVTQWIFFRSSTLLLLLGKRPDFRK
ncbi:hypothetical protein FK545_05755 [Planococcus glaciei]|nr:hypothetical protein [Planococcus glaciei]QDY45175.1 hypothetical protein FK545_05755 [Planococcus glaciei]